MNVTTAIKCNSMDEVYARGVGSFFIDRSDIKRPRFVCWIPGDTIPARLSLFNNGTDHWWQLGGTDDRPTLTPSVNNAGIWHGWLTDGEWREC